MVNSTLTTADQLREILHYEPRTGVFTWRVNRSNVHAGDVAGHIDQQGYRVIGINGRLYKAHRLAWSYMTGAWPEHQIDHINFAKSDNRWNNLRPATQAKNQWNAGLRADNLSGFKGVKKEGNKYIARIRVNGNSIYLGIFASPIEAAIAYHAAARWARRDYARAS